MKKSTKIAAAFAGGIVGALSIGVLAQISGGGVEGGSGRPAGNTFATQYRASSAAFGGTGPGTSGQVLTSNGAASAPTFQNAAVTSPAGSNTQVQYNNSGVFGASSSFTFTSASNLLNLGATSTPGTFSVGALDAMVVNGVTVPTPGFALNSNIQGVIENHSYISGGPTGAARYYGVRSRGTAASPLIVQSGDNLLNLLAAGYNGTNYSLAGQLLFTVGNTPGAADMPGDFDVLLSPDGSQTPQTRLKVFNTGALGISGSQGTTGQTIVSAGTGAAAAWGTLPFGGGGTGLTTAADDTTLVSSGSAWVASALPNCTDTGGNHLNYTTATNTFSCGTSSSGGGSSGTFTATFQTGFTTDATQTFQWSKSGSIVVLRATSQLSGTSDSTSIITTGADVPAAIRPSLSQIVSLTFDGIDNGAETPGVCLIMLSDGNIRYGVKGAADSTCTSTAWTASGTKSVGGSNALTGDRVATYSVD